MNIQRIFYTGLISDKTEKRNIAGFARFCGMSESLIYKIAHGITVPTVDVMTAYYRYTRDDEILHAMLEGTDRYPAPKPEVAKTRPVPFEAMECGAAVGELHAHISESMQDGKLTEKEKYAAGRILDHIQKEAEDVRVSLVTR